MAECTDVIEQDFESAEMCASKESLLSRVTPRILTRLETWTRVPATLIEEVIGRERERWVMPNTIDRIYLGAVLTRYSRTRYGGSRNKARVWQLKYRNYVWIWQHRAECRQRTAAAGVHMN